MTFVYLQPYCARQHRVVRPANQRVDAGDRHWDSRIAPDKDLSQLLTMGVRACGNDRIRGDDLMGHSGACVRQADLLNQLLPVRHG
jgi:hypothetical protein